MIEIKDIIDVERINGIDVSVNIFGASNPFLLSVHHRVCIDQTQRHLLRFRVAAAAAAAPGQDRRESLGYSTLLITSKKEPSNGKTNKFHEQCYWRLTLPPSHCDSQVRTDNYRTVPKQTYVQIRYYGFYQFLTTWSRSSVG